MDNEIEDAPARAGSTTLTIGTIILCLGVGYGLALLSQASMSLDRPSEARPTAADGTMPTQASQVVEGVVEVLEFAEGRYVGRIALKTDGVYRRTPELMTFRVAPETPVVMGLFADLHVGAIVHVRGAKAEETVIADRIVILTTNVRLE